MKKMAKMMPRNSTMVSVRQTGRFSLAFQRLHHLASARSHRRSSPTIIRFSTKAMHTPMSSGASRENRLEKSPPMVEILYRPQNSSTAKVMYARMLDEALAYGIEDENGILYIHFPIKELAAALSRSTMTIKRAMSELDDMGLVMRVRRDFSKPNRIYLLIPKADHTKSVKSRKKRIFDAGNASDEEGIAGAFSV